ncbi:MAG: peptidylprolyl isomerase [Puniceicoccaceae bacterium]
MRQILKFALPLLALSSPASAEVLVNTRLYDSEVIGKDTTFQLDLREFFQLYADPGPVATFTLYMPNQTGFKELVPADGSLVEVTEETPDDNQYMTYELTGGGSYDNAYDARAGDFVWAQTDVQYQLLADEAPISIANFLSYLRDGVYENTIVHRSDVNVVQAGGWSISDSDDFILKFIEKRSPIVLEQTRDNTEGTLAMARQQTPNTATSEFFINLQDNTGFFRNFYAVFGELLNPETALPLLQQMGDAYVYNISQFIRTAPLVTTPLYTPYWDDKDSFLRFQSISVPEGNPDGVSYSFEWVDVDGVEGTSEEEAASQALFNVSIDGSTLNVSRTGTGTAPISIVGEGAGDTRNFEIFLVAFNPSALEAFPVSDILPDGWLENSWFGFLVADDFPYIQHFNHGFQYVVYVEGENVLSSTFYLYDYQLGSWLYTTPNTYPFLFSYALDTWLWYEEGTGNGVDGDRTFFNYATGENIQG